jgi:hypothetical protein
MFADDVMKLLGGVFGNQVVIVGGDPKPFDAVRSSISSCASGLRQALLPHKPTLFT